MILVVLAMTALSLLAFGSARSNESMTRRNADVGASYYVAADQVQRTLAQVDEKLLLGQQQAADLAWYEAEAPEGVTFEETEEGLTFSFTTDIGNDLGIYVLGVAGEGAERYRVVEHRVVENIDYGFGGDDYILLMGE
jgi:hypothetical protein